MFEFEIELEYGMLQIREWRVHCEISAVYFVFEIKWLLLAIDAKPTSERRNSSP